MERDEKSMKNISLALAFDYLEDVNYLFKEGISRQ